MPSSTEPRRTLRFAPLPATGIWTAVGLDRGTFFAILVGACLVYLLWGGPLWSKLGEDDFARIAVSYAVIPVAAALALGRRGRLTLATFLAAAGVIAVLKLLITAGLALLFDLGRPC